MVKHMPTMWETLVQSLGQEALLEKEMASHSSILAWNIPWRYSRNLLGHSLWGCKELDTTEWLHFTSNYGGGIEDNGDLPQKIPCLYCYSPRPNPAAGLHWPTPSLEIPGHPQARLVGSLSFLLGPGAQGSVVPSKNLFPVLCKYWQLYGGLNGGLLQEDLCHTHTQSPRPCGRPLLTHTSTGDTQTQFCLSLWGVPGSWCA